jgi:hypothetical protein
MLTIKELSRLLAQNNDPDTLIELLDISSEEICERFEDKIEEKAGTLVIEYEENQEEKEDYEFNQDTE